MSVTPCGELKAEMESSGLELQSYIDSLQELLECLMLIHRKWIAYQDILDSRVLSEHAYQAPALQRRRERKTPF